MSICRSRRLGRRLAAGVLLAAAILLPPMAASGQQKANEPAPQKADVPPQQQMAVPPTKGGAEELRIIGVVPELVTPDGELRIMLAGADDIKVLNEFSISVQVGGRLAKITNMAGGTIVALAPANLPAGQKVEIKVFLAGRTLVTTAQVAPQAQTADEFWRQTIYMVVIGVFTLLATVVAALVWIRLNALRAREREAARAVELQAEIDKLKLREERRVTALPERPTVEARQAAIKKVESLPPLVPDVPTELVEAINRGECALFWGSGFSAQAGYPTWHEALAEIIASPAITSVADLRAQLQRALEAGHASLVVELLATRLGRPAVVEELRRQWGSPREPNSAIETASRMRFANVVTSVWDSLIDRVFAARQPTLVTGVSNDSIDSLLSREAFCVVRLWGALDRPDTVLFTTNEYRAALAGNPTFAKYVTSLAHSQTHFFVGTSLDTIEEYLSGTRGLSKSRTHYALVPEGDSIALSREVFRERYGVELLVFRPTPGWPELGTFLNGLKRAVDASAPSTPRADIEPFRLVKVHLENVGPFKSSSIDLDPSWTVLLGNNGSGKSTLLRAIALVLCGDDPRAMAAGSQLLRVGATSGFIELTVGDVSYRTILNRRSDGTVDVNAGTQVSPLKTGRWVALAFPPLRGVSAGDPKGPTTEGASRPEIEDVLPILTGQIDGRIGSLKQWLVNLDIASTPHEGVSDEAAARNRRLRDHFFDVFNAFVPGTDVKFSSVDRKTWRVNVETNGVIIGLDQVSQGTSSILGWVGALLQRMYEIHGTSKDIRNEAALVLIDEIDAHLHPEWQQRIIITLREQLPGVQFIATTHSPLIVGELKRNQVYRVKMENGDVVAEHPVDEIQGMGYGALLTGENFGLARYVDQKTQDLLEKQRQLSLGDEKLTQGQKDDLAKVNAELEKLGFGYQMRDLDFMAYLKSRYQRDAAGAPDTSIAVTSPAPNARVKDLIAKAAAQAADRSQA